VSKAMHTPCRGLLASRRPHHFCLWLFYCAVKKKYLAWDCGMFVCLYADVISAGVQLTDQGCFTGEDVTVARKWIAHTILTKLTG